MRKPDRRRGGFTLIEVLISTVLLVLVASGFMAMTASNLKLLTKEDRMERSNYSLSSLAASGGGEPTGETLTVIFTTDEGEGGSVEEIFGEYRVRENWDDMEYSMTFYRHRQG